MARYKVSKNSPKSASKGSVVLYVIPPRIFQRIPTPSSKLDPLPDDEAPRDYPGKYTPSAFANIDSEIVRGNYKEWAL